MKIYNVRYAELFCCLLDLLERCNLVDISPLQERWQNDTCPRKSQIRRENKLGGDEVEDTDLK